MYFKCSILMHVPFIFSKAGVVETTTTTPVNTPLFRMSEMTPTKTPSALQCPLPRLAHPLTITYFKLCNTRHTTSWCMTGLGASLNHVDRFLDIFDPPPPFWTILLNTAYVVKGTVGNTLPLPNSLYFIKVL